MPRLELIKIVARAIVAERDETGRITGEHETEQAALYTAEHVGGYFSAMQAQIEANNEELAKQEEEAAAAASPNRASRRSSARGKKSTGSRSRK